MSSISMSGKLDAFRSASPNFRSASPKAIRSALRTSLTDGGQSAFTVNLGSRFQKVLLSKSFCGSC